MAAFSSIHSVFPTDLNPTGTDLEEVEEVFKTISDDLHSISPSKKMPLIIGCWSLRRSPRLSFTKSTLFSGAHEIAASLYEDGFVLLPFDTLTKAGLIAPAPHHRRS